MSLRLTCEWQAAPDVRTTELAATWSRLTIEVDDIIATLVEERGRSHGVRKSIDVPTYPLAEHLAINWWTLSAMAHRPGFGDVRLAEAGSGFPWRDITLRADRDFMWAHVFQRNRDPDFVRFLAQGDAVLDAGDTLEEISRFIESTVRRLESVGIHGTFLQQEWDSIQGADSSEREFCTVAAAWGFDPYDMPAEISDKLMDAGKHIGHDSLLIDLARAVNFDSIDQASRWLTEASSLASVGSRGVPIIESIVGSKADTTRPWRVGYRLAERARRVLNLTPTQQAPIDELVHMSETSDDPPPNVDGLVRLGLNSAGLVLGEHLGATARRFAGARAIARRAIGTTTEFSLLTRGSRYSDRVERAFAAEFLAPADGLRTLLDGDFSEDAQHRVAEELGVSSWVIRHQVDNQLAA